MNEFRSPCTINWMHSLHLLNIKYSLKGIFNGMNGIQKAKLLVRFNLYCWIDFIAELWFKCMFKEFLRKGFTKTENQRKRHNELHTKARVCWSHWYIFWFSNHIFLCLFFGTSQSLASLSIIYQIKLEGEWFSNNFKSEDPENDYKLSKIGCWVEPKSGTLASLNHMRLFCYRNYYIHLNNFCYL